MKAEEIIKVYKRSFKKLRRYYRRLIKHCSEEDNHNFRVEIKKLRAFIRLVNLCHPEHLQKITKSIKEFYHIAGDIRNLQLHNKRMEHLCEDLLIEEPGLYLQCLDKEIKKKKKALNEAAKQVTFKKFRKELINETPEELTSDIKITFVKNSLSYFAQLLILLSSNEEVLHEIRKLLKDLMYNYEYLHPYVSTMMPAGLNDIPALEKLTAALGDYHDLTVGVYLLSSDYLIQITAGSEITAPEQLGAHLQLTIKHLRNELISFLMPIKLQMETKPALEVENLS